ncbi:hypothetical protein I3842_02G071000 [Carya illinoinensis]|uniref:Uncharacterized protein n=1 Tax=Carya illinoinensis TaxID=32201 RepID=A0A922FSQ3_CARIL|nr:hypothetical protein I3842_02G071000 [Carya illinoinensis]
MDAKAARGRSSNVQREDETMDLRRGPWTVDEDFTLINYITNHGEGRWNSLARAAGLKRTGKSCRLRWLNYLRPDVRRGNITLEEQLMILELHSRWGNRWSKIAQYLPGRTDNEIKNYWRTRVQKHAKQLKCDVNSKQFKDAMRYLWMPRLVERIQAAAAATTTTAPATTRTEHLQPARPPLPSLPILIIMITTLASTRAKWLCHLTLGLQRLLRVAPRRILAPPPRRNLTAPIRYRRYRSSRTTTLTSRSITTLVRIISRLLGSRARALLAQLVIISILRWISKPWSRTTSGWKVGTHRTIYGTLRTRGFFISSSTTPAFEM